jgi:hypothetical protein
MVLFPFLQHLIPSSRMVLALFTDENKTECKTYFVISLIDGQQAAAALPDGFIGGGP